MDIKEKRVRNLTHIYYMNPDVRAALLSFGREREVVPRYFEGFGKRPDILQYPSDIRGLVKKGATSFHASLELWKNPLELSSEITAKEMSELRKGWDLLIDIDSPFIDYSKIAALLLLQELERQGVMNYGIKFSGSRGFHIIVSGNAFPRELNGEKMSESFPEWPRAICRYLEFLIREEFNSKIFTERDVKNLETRTNKKREELVESVCPDCGNSLVKDTLFLTRCKLCENHGWKKKSILGKKRVLRCDLDNAMLEVIEEKEIFLCPKCKTSNFKLETYRREKVEKAGRELSESYTNKMRENIKQKESGGFDLVLVAPRHLFRMPYSLHEKTALASVVLNKEEIDTFNPGDASPLKIKVKEFMPNNKEEEARMLVSRALEWQRERESEEKKFEVLKYGKFKEKREFAEVDFKNVTEEAYPPAIIKLLKGLSDGRKRGLFILLTFLRAIGKSPDEINKDVRKWNEKNSPPLKEGYLRSQIEWHLRQKKKILPPNYDNQAYYMDLGLINKKQEAKNPLVDISRKLRGSKVF